MEEFGRLNGNRKIKNFCELGQAPFSIVAFHNKFFRQIRYSFVIGSYYPALTGTCSLGERILNHLLLQLRDDFKTTKEYKEVYRRDSYDDWDLAIRALSSWGVLLPSVVASFRKLSEIRNRKAIHFNPETDRNDRNYALKAIKSLSDIIGEQFGGTGTQPWFIENTKGASYIKKEYEAFAFVKKIYLPNCLLVSPFHRLEYREGKWGAIDDFNYESKEISDKEFVDILERHRKKERN